MRFPPWLRSNRAALIAVLLAAFALRLAGVFRFSPELAGIDEEHYVIKAIELLRNAEPHDYFVNPPLYTLMLYWTYLAASLARGLVKGLPLEFSQLADYACSHLGYFLFLARLVNTAIATFTCWLVWRIMQDLGRPKAAAPAALLFALLPLSVDYAWFATNETLLAFCIALFLWRLLRYEATGTPLNAGLVGAAFGLGAMTKYTMALLALPLLYVMARRMREKLPVHGVAVFGAGLVAAIVACPWLTHNPRGVLGGMKAVVVASRYPWIGQNDIPLVIAARTVLTSFGVLGTCLLTWGAVRAWTDRGRRWWWVMLLGPFLPFVLATHVFFPRYIFPILVPLCLLAGLGMAALLDWARLSRAPRVMLLAAAFLHPLLLSVHNALIINRQSSQSVATRWCTANLPPTCRVLADLYALERTATMPFEAEFTWNLETFADSTAVKQRGFDFYAVGEELLQEEMLKENREFGDFTNAGNWIRDNSRLKREFPSVKNSGGPFLRLADFLMPGNEFRRERPGPAVFLFESTAGRRRAGD